MSSWPILAIFWNGYPPSPITGFMNCCRIAGNPLNNKKHPKRTKPTKAGLVKGCLPDGYDHSDAQPEIQELARQMQQALRRSSPSLLNSGEFHLPYVLPAEIERYKGTENEWLLPVLSTARCARVSYMNHDGTNPSVARDKKL